MRILILTMNVGRTAPGIVFEKLIRGLSKYHEIDVLTVDNQPADDLKVNVRLIKYLNFHPRIKKMLIGLCGFNFSDFIWGKKILKHLESQSKEYDIIFSLMSYGYYASLIANQLVYKSKLYKSAKYYVYCVDAVPAPLGWTTNDLYFLGCKALMRTFTKHVDGFFSSNNTMLQYQLSLLDMKKESVSDVIYTPTQNRILNLPLPSDIIFLYTGGIYGPRKVCYLLGAFKRLRTVYPSAKLRFVGTIIPSDQMQDLSNDDVQNIEIYPFTSDLNKHYEESMALIDIDCDLDNDVFISSKIINYLSVNRVILSETSYNSPSYNLFSNVDSIFISDHSVDSIYNNMIKVINNYRVIDFSDRNRLLGIFDQDKIVDNLLTKYVDNF